MKGKMGKKRELTCQMCGKKICRVVHNQSETFLLKKYKWGTVSLYDPASNFHIFFYLCEKCFKEIYTLLHKRFTAVIPLISLEEEKEIIREAIKEKMAK